ncbi:hypothetical protein PT2222_190111 [Paraburkholderia tropica]
MSVGISVGTGIDARACARPGTSTAGVQSAGARRTGAFVMRLTAQGSIVRGALNPRHQYCSIWAALGVPGAQCPQRDARQPTAGAPRETDRPAFKQTQ